MSVYTATITATAGDIDELGHVNNAVWVRWVQEIATAHWYAAGDPAHVAAYVWVITRHEIDYLKLLREGGTVTARTWAEGPPKGARTIRLMEFADENGDIHVRSRTEWAMIDRMNGRPLRVGKAIIQPFLR